MTATGLNKTLDSSNSQPLPDPKPEDTATTKAELLERTYALETDVVNGERPAKRTRTDDSFDQRHDATPQRQKGVAPIKVE